MEERKAGRKRYRDRERQRERERESIEAMSGLLIAATTAALTEVDRTTHMANTFLDEVTSAQDELEPVLVELFGLGGLLRQLRNADTPKELQPPVTRVIRGCADICKRTDAVLSGCGDGSLRSRRWALTDAPVEIQESRVGLEACRRTVEIVVEALEL